MVGRRAFLAGLLSAVCSAALAQSLGGGLGLSDIRLSAGGGVLDTFTQPAAAYSFRKLRSAYAGPAMRLQRVDTTTADIGFVGDNFDVAAATAFCTTACTAVIWYDQSGNGRNLAPTVVGPSYTVNCVGTQPCLRFLGGGTVLQGATLTPATGVASLSSVSRRFSGTTTCAALHETISGNRLSFTNTTASYTLAGSSGTIVAPQAEAAWHVVSGVVNGASSNLTVDGVAVTGTITGSVVVGVPGLGGASATNCDSVEVVLWDAYALPPATQIAWGENQRNYWTPLPLDTFQTPAAAYSMRRLKSTYTGPAIRLRRASDNAEADIGFLGFTSFTGAPIDTVVANAHCAATTCTVATWYDQSGNARHTTQATPTNQPAYVANCNGALPCLRGTVDTQNLEAASTPFTVASPMSLGAVGKRDTTTVATCVPIFAFYNYIYTSPGNPFWTLRGIGEYSNGAATDGAWHAAAAVIGPTSAFRIDDFENTSAAVIQPGTATIVTASGNAAGTICDWGEALIWNGYGLTANERLALVTNQRSFWGIP